MPKKRYTPEEIVAKLRQVDVLVSQGQNIADAIRQIGVSEVTYYRWRQEYGGLKADQVKRLKELEQENSRLRRAISDLTLDKSFCRRLPGETSKPRASSRLYRADPKACAEADVAAGVASNEVGSSILDRLCGCLASKLSGQGRSAPVLSAARSRSATSSCSQA